MRAERERSEDCKDIFDDCDAFDCCGESFNTPESLYTGTVLDNDGATLDSRKL